MRLLGNFIITMQVERGRRAEQCPSCWGASTNDGDVKRKQTGSWIPTLCNETWNQPASHTKHRVVTKLLLSFFPPTLKVNRKFLAILEPRGEITRFFAQLAWGLRRFRTLILEFQIAAYTWQSRRIDFGVLWGAPWEFSFSFGYLYTVEFSNPIAPLRCKHNDWVISTQIPIATLAFAS